MPEAFSGYRADGRPGVRNHLLVVSVMDNVNGIVRGICGLVRGAVPITHPYGRAQLGEDRARHLQVLAGLASNPNVGAAVIVSLERTHAEEVRDRMRADKPTAIVVVNEHRSTLEAVTAGAASAARLLVEISQRRRRAADLGQLYVAVECGGSDGTSAAVTNPVVGLLTDRLVQAGATVVMSEPSEWIGAEDILAKQAASPALGRRIRQIARWYEDYANQQGVDLRGVNPSPDNIAGGITTIEEKSLGSIAKAGHSTVQEVLGLGEAPRKSGLVLMDAPAGAVENLTSMAASGAQICVFSTGSGNPTANPVLPIVRLSANPAVTWGGTDVDLSLDRLMRGRESPEHAANALYRLVLKVASGRATWSEAFYEGDVAISRCGFSL